MKSFWIKVVNVLVIVGILFGYNTVLASRKQSEEIAELKYKLENSASAEDDAQNGNYVDGTYTGSAKGFGGPIDVEVTVEGGKLTKLDIISAEKEDTAYLDAAKDIINRIIENQSTDIDTVSGATFSSTGIKNAAIQALEGATK